MERSLLYSKVFVFNPYSCSPNDGGPSGVIAQNLLGHHLNHVVINPVQEENVFALELLRKRYFPPPVPAFYHDWFLRCRKLYRCYQVRRFPVVFFHDVFSLTCCLDLIPRGQTIVLQSHCPELPHQEVAASSFTNGEIILWVKQVEARAFARADVAIFPNNGAVDIYRRLLKESTRVYYLPTGARPVSGNAKVPLDPSLCHFLFIGRRNRVKGFDLVLEAFRRAYRLRPEFRLLLLGRGQVLDEPGVIDLGYCENPHLWYRSCDFVINLNRQSYFDLSVLEALSVGAHIIMSLSEGHREFQELAPEGVTQVISASVESLLEVLLSEILQKNPEGATRNIAWYASQHSDAVYRSNLDSLAATLLGAD